MNRISLVLSLLLASLCLANAQTAPAGAPPAVAKMLDLFARLRAPQGGHVAFSLTENEINDYLKHSLRQTPRPGLDAITIKVFAQNYLSTFTVVDFDAVERWKPGTIPMLLRPVLSGRKSVWVDYRFHAWDGHATFSVEKAYFQNIRLPAVFVEKVIAIVAARQPEKYDTSKPIPLPFGLKKVWTHDRVVQGEK